MLHLIWYFLDTLNNVNQNSAGCFTHKKRVSLGRLLDSSPPHRVRKMPRSGDSLRWAADYVKCISSGDARVILRENMRRSYLIKSDQISEHMLQIAGYLARIFYEHIHQNAAKGICYCS